MLYGLSLLVLVPTYMAQNRQLDVGFLRNGTLEVASDHLTLPDIGQLVVRSGNHTRRVTHIEQLQGLVSIRSANLALQYVRLLTSPATSKFFLDAKNPSAEVIAASRVDSDFFFGDNESAALIPPRKLDGMYGIVSDQWWKRNRLHQAVVGAFGNGWVVVRTALLSSSDHLVPYVVKETVSRNGKYTMQLLRKLDVQKPSLVGFWIPKEQ